MHTCIDHSLYLTNYNKIYKTIEAAQIVTMKLIIIIRLFVITILLSQFHQPCHGWSWFSSNDQTQTNPNPSDDYSSSVLSLVGAEFALDSLENDERTMNLVENAKLRMRASKSCWANAYGNMFAGCSKIVGDQELKDRLAWDLSDCFQKHSGRKEFPFCNPKYPTKNCLKQLDDDAHKVYLQYFLQIDSICHQLQIHAFKHQTERLVNDLKKSAEYAEEKLENIEERGKTLLQDSKQIHGSLASIDQQTQQVAETSRDLQENVSVLKTYSEQVYEQSKGIAASQEEVMRAQNMMKEKINEGMSKVQDSYNSLGAEISNLKDETAEIEKGIDKVGEAMFSKMASLQSKADDIGNLAGSSLVKQKQLLDTQTETLDGLRRLTSFQSKALEESRSTLQKLSEFGKKQLDELLNRQEQLQKTHDKLSESSKTMLEAQEAFESKQASMLNTLEKVFELCKMMEIESRMIKVFIIYSLLMFVIYIFTSMKQTYNVRPRLCLGLTVALLIELSILRCSKCSSDHQNWILALTRSVFLLIASSQLLYSMFTYRDYEMLNHQMLLGLIDKVNGIEKTKHLQLDMDDEDDDDNDDAIWSCWVDSDLPEDVTKSEDPDYTFTEQIGENSHQNSSVTKRYNLRNRHK